MSNNKINNIGKNLFPPPVYINFTNNQFKGNN
jgi:hypothetical protein